MTMTGPGALGVREITLALVAATLGIPAAAGAQITAS